jgi:4-carboxymuconolactone decarboxylase
MTRPTGRLPEVDTTALTDEQQRLHESLMSRPEVAALGLVGPFGVWMHAPEMGLAMSRLGGIVRFGSSLAANVTEVAICTTGSFHRAKFEFAAHRGLAIRAGVDEAAVDRLGAGEDPGFEGDEAAAQAVATEILRDHRVSEATYADAEARFGSQGMVELLTTIGYYCLISTLLNGFDIPLVEGMTDPFPDAS